MIKIILLVIFGMLVAGICLAQIGSQNDQSRSQYNYETNTPTNNPSGGGS